MALPLEGSVRTDVDDTSFDINVDANVNYLVGDTVRIGDELIKVSSVANIGTGTATIHTAFRGADVTYTNFLSSTVKDAHSVGDEIFVCEVSDDERIDDLLERILIDIGVDQSFIPKADWTAEVDEWHPTTRVNTLWIESESTNDVLAKILSNFMIDMWFDPVAREIKISAISAWQESTSALSESDQINFESISRKREETLRSTRALVIYNKRFLATSDSVENFKQASLFKRTELESADLFGEPKTKQFDFSSILSKDAADLLVNRWVNRYINPFSYSWTTPERKLNFNTGDVVDINSDAEVGFDGLPSKISRAQITSVKPNYRNEGRDYTITATSYEPLFSTGSEIVIRGNITDINLFIQYAGAPSEAVELTFIFDGAIGGGSSSVIPAIKAGAFPAGSKLIFIMVNGADLQSKGGDGGDGAVGAALGSPPPIGNIPDDGVDGGTVYDAQGIDTDIYFSGATLSGNYPVADGFIRAPSGGAGGFDWEEGSTGSPGGEISFFITGDGGDGGDGRAIGIGGAVNKDANVKNGSEDGTRTGWGNDGVNNNAFGGSKGKGVVDSGATVTFFGDTPARYINGGGDH